MIRKPLASIVLMSLLALTSAAAVAGVTFDLPLATSASLTETVNDTAITITRATTASYYDADGVLQTAASGAARFDHNPATGASLGLLVEEARTNLLLQSEDFSTTWVETGTAVVSTNTTVAPDGTTTADTLTDNDAAAFENMSQALAVADDNATYVFIIFVEKTSSDILAVNFNLTGGSTSVAANARYQPSTNTFSLSSPSGVASEDVGDYYRLSWPIVNNTTGNTTLTVNIYPAARATIDSSDTTTPTGSQIFWGAQLEAGAFPTSYIPTTTTSVTRNADVVTATDVSWLNTGVGTLYAKYTLGAVTSEGISRRIVGLSDGTTNNRIVQIDAQASSVTDTNLTITASGVTQASLSDNVNYTKGQEVKLATAWATNDAAASTNGRTVLADSSVTVPLGIDRLSVGSHEVGSGSGPINSHIAAIRYWDSRLSNALLDYYSTNGLADPGVALRLVLDRARSTYRIRSQRSRAAHLHSRRSSINVESAMAAN